MQAIWTALVNEYRLQYINPPPAYSEQSQRLRTPSDILASNSGTCIDLALLLASCLEYIDIYPVVVLLVGPRLRRLLAHPKRRTTTFVEVAAHPGGSSGCRQRGARDRPACRSSIPMAGA